MHLTLWTRAALAMCLLMCLLLGGCYVEVDERNCFGGGEERLGGDNGDTEVCCDPDEGSSNTDICRPFFRASKFSAVVDLSVCGADGRCALDCREGVNCECLVGAECGKDFGCRMVNSPLICDHHKQMGGAGFSRCSICDDCQTDDDCTSPPDPFSPPPGLLCIKANADDPSGYCGCRTDNDCAQGKVCTESACQ